MRDLCLKLLDHIKCYSSFLRVWQGLLGILESQNEQISCLVYFFHDFWINFANYLFVLLFVCFETPNCFEVSRIIKFFVLHDISVRIFVALNLFFNESKVLSNLWGFLFNCVSKLSVHLFDCLPSDCSLLGSFWGCFSFFKCLGNIVSESFNVTWYLL